MVDKSMVRDSRARQSRMAWDRRGRVGAALGAGVSREIVDAADGLKGYLGNTSMCKN